MQKKLIISGLCFLCLFFARCADPFATEEFAAYDELPIGLYLETKPEYAEWVKLLKKADVFNAVNINIKYTCFVANNEAVARYIKNQNNPNWKTVDDLTEDEAKNLTKYHIIRGSDYTYISLSGKLGSKTASDDYLTASMSEDGNIRYINGVEVLASKKDQKLINGYVQELSEVLNPIIYTVMEVLEQHPEYSIMTQAFKACGLDEYLSRREIIINKTPIRDYKTILIGNDSTFHAEGIYSLNDLKERFEGEPTDPKSDFYKFVAYHIFSKSMDYADLTTFDLGVMGMNIETYVSKEFITIAQDKSNEIFINPGLIDSLRFISKRYDIPASNGYIHEVSGIMPITDPVRYQMEWEPTDYDACRTIPFFRTSKTKGQSDNIREDYWFKEGELPFLRWKTIPYKEKVVSYMSVDIDWDRFINDDCIYANLGTVGWIEFDTPVLMRGKYNIQMVKWLWGENTGNFQFYIDDEKFGTVLMGGGEGTKNFGTFNFRDSGTHKFRFNVIGVDGKDKVANFYCDRFMFTPVE